MVPTHLQVPPRLKSDHPKFLLIPLQQRNLVPLYQGGKEEREK